MIGIFRRGLAEFRYGLVVPPGVEKLLAFLQQRVRFVGYAQGGAATEHDTYAHDTPAQNVSDYFASGSHSRSFL